MGFDWVFAFRPAIMALLAGQSPYSLHGYQFVNAPWALLPLLPLALLPEWAGYLALIAISLCAFGFIAYRLKAAPLAMVAFLLSPFVLRCLYMGQIDWLPMIGVVLPPQIGLIFIATKPQTCGIVALYWLIEAAKRRTVIRTFAPVAIITALSFIPFGFWPGKMNGFGVTNALWPFSIALSVALFVMAYIRRDKNTAAAASPLISPYAQPHSFAVMLLPFMRHSALMIMAVVASWIVEVVI